MSENKHPSAIDALVEGEVGLRQQVEDLADERDDAARQATKLARAVEDRSDEWWDEDGKSKSDSSDAGDEPTDPVQADIEVLRAERDSFLADSQRLAADFANYRKLSDKRIAESAATQSSGLVRDLLPVLDACDSALEQDPDSAVGPIRSALLNELEKNGLELISPGAPTAFDPEQHDAVQHEPHDPDAEPTGPTEPEGPVVAELLRAGYAWKGRVIRPAMVKVVG